LLGRTPARDSSVRQIALGHNARHTAGRIFRRDSFDLRVGPQKAPALLEGHRMRLNRGDGFERRAGTADQAVTDRNDDFTGDVQIAVQQKVVASMDKTGKAVFDRREYVIRSLVVDSGKERVEGGARHELDLFAQQFDGRLFTESPRFPLER